MPAPLDVGDPAPPFDRQPVFGRRVRVPGPRPVALFFVGGLASPFARAALFAIQERVADLDLAGLDAVAVAPGRLEAARDFVPRHHLLFPLVLDEDGALARQWRIGRDPWLLQTLKGLGRVPLRPALRALELGAGRPDGGGRRLASQFIVDTDGTLRHARHACSILALPDVDALLKDA